MPDNNSKPVVLPKCVPTECGKDFRESLKKPSPNQEKWRKMNSAVRFVPAFTIQAMQRNTRINPPPPTGIYDALPLKETGFKKSYLQGEFPVSIQFTNRGKRLLWKVPVEKLDYNHYLPMLFEGLSEDGYPFNFIVENGIKDMVLKAPYKVLPVVPQIIIPLKNALATKRPSLMCYVMRCIQMLVKNCHRVGEALVPYYRQILPIVNVFKVKHRGVNNEVIVPENDLNHLIEETLQAMERNGGPDAFINMKYMIPTYESCMLN